MKPDILSFLENKRLLRKNSLHQINHLPMEKKVKEIEFSTLATQYSNFLTVTCKLFGTLIQI